MLAGSAEGADTPENIHGNSMSQIKFAYIEVKSEVTFACQEGACLTMVSSDSVIFHSIHAKLCSIQLKNTPLSFSLSMPLCWPRVRQ